MNILDILRTNGVPYQLAPHARVRRGQVGVDCPKCSPSSQKYRLAFDLQYARAHCWVCGSQFADTMLALMLHIPAGEARQLLDNLPRRPVWDRAPEEHHELRLPEGIEDGLLVPHRYYLQHERRLDPDEVARVWGIRSIGMIGRLKWRLFIPIMDRFGTTVSWTTRSINKATEPRYWSAAREEEAVSHKSLLYGAHLAKHTIVVVEGPVDCWTLGPGTVATCGVGFTQDQAALMSEYPVRVVLFDAEDDAQERGNALCEALAIFPGQTVRHWLTTGKDPNSADPAEVLEFRKTWLPEQFLGKSEF
jgi:hypothetical protein